jgi:predicted homoserine dehydrogenase-like protein
MSNASQEKLRVGLVGTGYVSKHHLRALKKLDYVEVAALCDSNLDRARKAATESGIAGVYRSLMFYEDACKSGFTLSGNKSERRVPAGAAQGVA